MWWLLVSCTAGDVAITLRSPRSPGPPDTLVGDCAGRWEAGLRINELVPGNVDGVRDEGDTTSDWLELHHSGESPQSLAGWSLETEDGAWSLPNVSLAPGGLLSVFASGKYGEPGFVQTEVLHASFALSAVEDRLRLMAPDGCVVDEAIWTDAPADWSLGRHVDRPSRWEWFAEPTFGMLNTTASRSEISARPWVDPAGGVYSGEVRAGTDGRRAVLRYSLDSREPQQDDPAWPGSLQVAPDALPVVLRIRAFEEGRWPGPVVTATYFSPTALAAGLDVVSLVSAPGGLFSEETGIWAYGESYERSYPYFDANFWEDWERPVHMTYTRADGDTLLRQDAGLRIHGGYSRAFDQRGLRLLARDAWLDDTFSAALFPRDELDSYHSLVLHNGGDWCSTHLMDASSDLLLRDAQGQRHHPADFQAWTPVMVYLNGAFWGMYQLRERMDEHWLADHHDAGPVDQVELGWTHAPHWELEQGDWEAFNRLNDYVAAYDLGDSGAWAGFEAQVDVVNLASLAAVQAWYNNSDFGTNNLRLWRDRDGGPWRWMLYDLGHGWPAVESDQLGAVIAYRGDGMPFGAALENPTFRWLFAAVLADYLNSSLSPEIARARIDQMAAAVQPGMTAQLDRWCSGTSLGTWAATVEYARDYAENRGGVLREQARTHLGLGADRVLTLTADPVGGGRFGLTAVEVDAPFSGRYYQGTPMAVRALPAPGYRFSGWRDGQTAEIRDVALSDDVQLIAEFEPE